MRKGSRCDGEESSCAAAAGGLPGMVAGVLQYVGTYYIYTRCKAGGLGQWVHKNQVTAARAPPVAPPHRAVSVTRPSTCIVLYRHARGRRRTVSGRGGLDV